MYDLALQVNPENWSLYLRRKADPAFRPVRDKVFKRDHYTCQYCGFQAKEYQDVVNLDSNYRNNKSSNMVTACCFCVQCLFIEEVGRGDFGGGKLIYLPEMTQLELNSFCHVIFCAITNGTNYKDIAQSVYRSLKFRSQTVEDKFGVGTSSPNVFGQILLEYEGENSEDVKKELFGNFRLLPSYVKFRKQLERWAISAAEELEEAG